MSQGNQKPAMWAGSSIQVEGQDRVPVLSVAVAWSWMRLSACPHLLFPHLLRGSDKAMLCSKMVSVKGTVGSVNV